VLYRFNSRASSSFVMLEAHARRLFDILGKEATPKGIITVEQMPAAIAALEAAMRGDAHPHDDDEAEAGRDGEAEKQVIGIRQRAAPLLRMLKKSLADNKDVTWEV
jgi:hypothetical protein